MFCVSKCAGIRIVDSRSVWFVSGRKLVMISYLLLLLLYPFKKNILCTFVNNFNNFIENESVRM